MIPIINATQIQCHYTQQEIVDTRCISVTVAAQLFDIGHKMLIDAFNNRTRERNYFRLYSQLCDGEITEEQFDAELDNNSDQYVIEAPKNDVSQEVLSMAMAFAPQMKDMETVDDVSAMFSLNPAQVNDMLALPNHQAE